MTTQRGGWTVYVGKWTAWYLVTVVTLEFIIIVAQIILSK